MIGHRFTEQRSEAILSLQTSTRVDTATAASSESFTTALATATYFEVQELRDEARLYGWQKGMEEGYKMMK
jgi:hypothetical protein